MTTHAWYKQGWPWFLIALPGVAVIASFISLAIALHYGDSALQDNYSKHGFAIQRNAQLDAQAAQQQVQADLAFTARGAIALDLHGALAAPPAALTLSFIHPFDAHGDFSVALQRAGAGNDSDSYRGQLPANARGRWTVELSDPAQQWRLRAAIDFSQLPAPLALHLAP